MTCSREHLVWVLVAIIFAAVVIGILTGCKSKSSHDGKTEYHGISVGDGPLGQPMCSWNWRCGGSACADRATGTCIMEGRAYLCVIDRWFPREIAVDGEYIHYTRVDCGVAGTHGPLESGGAK